jgi:hypothetical protein
VIAITLSAMRSVVAFLAALLALVACSACGTSHGASGSSVLRTAAAYPTALEGGAPITLGAATVAAQANIDRFTAGDFAGVWEHMAKDVRSGNSKADFVTFYETCKKPGPRLNVTGVRLDPDGQAIVRMVTHGVERSRFMVYEDGVWNMQATDDFASRLGEPLQQIISEEKAAGLCTR